MFILLEEEDSKTIGGQKNKLQGYKRVNTSNSGLDCWEGFLTSVTMGNFP